MPLTVAVQMDPIERINIDSDSSFALMEQAQARGHDVLYYQPKHLSLRDGVVSATVTPLVVRRKHGDHFTAAAPRKIDLATVDVVLMRQDPPFDMGYITATHILEHLAGKALVVNDPFHVRNAPEKLFVTQFEGLMPPTLISSDAEEIRAFRAAHKDIIVKPLYGNGGAGIFHLPPEDSNLNPLLELFTQLYREPVIVQKYLSAVKQGDKRIILVEGEPVGALNRIPAHGEVRSNLAAGGVAQPTELTPRDYEICAAIGPELKKRGLVFAGIDVIGHYLTEINVTSPTGILAVKKFGGPDIAALIWDAIEARLGRS